jgi:hypothetical protein
MIALNRRFALAGALLVSIVACDAPSAPLQDARMRLVPGTRAALCDAAVNPICSAFITTTYKYNPAIAPLQPGVSDWTLKITQIGGVLEFFGAISHGGPPIVDISNMYVRFYLDNGDGSLGGGDLQVVLRSNHGATEIFCGLVTALPTGDVIAPDDAAQLCPVNGTGFDDGTRFIFDGYRTTDLTETTWQADGFEPLAAGQQRAIWLFEVGNVAVNGTDVVLLAPTAPASVAYGLELADGVPDDDDNDNGGGGDDDENGGGDDDTTAPTIVFSGNAGNYALDAMVSITCSATDSESGIAVVNCPSVNALAYTFGAGITTLTATAVDSAGNAGAASTSFNVAVTADGLCAIARSMAKNAGIGNALCAQLTASMGFAGKGDAPFAKHVRAQRGKGLAAADADLLLALFAAL